MSKRDSALYLQDILTATEKIEEYIQGLSAGIRKYRGERW